MPALAACNSLGCVCIHPPAAKPAGALSVPLGRSCRLPRQCWRSHTACLVAESRALQAAADSCELPCTLMQTISLNLDQGVALNPRNGFVANAKAFLVGSGSGGRSTHSRTLAAQQTGGGGRLRAAQQIDTAIVATQLFHWSEKHQCVRACVLAGEGVTLLSGSYLMPMSFSGILNFARWGLRLLVRCWVAHPCRHCLLGHHGAFDRSKLKPVPSPCAAARRQQRQHPGGLCDQQQRGDGAGSLGGPAPHQHYHQPRVGDPGGSAGAGEQRLGWRLGWALAHAFLVQAPGPTMLPRAAPASPDLPRPTLAPASIPCRTTSSPQSSTPPRTRPCSGTSSCASTSS